MTEVLFYHLVRQRLEDVLPTLLEKTLARGWKAVVELADMSRRDALDLTLWTYRDDSFLPHGVEGEGTAARQPIVLTAGPANPNGAEVRFLDGTVTPSGVEDYARVVLLFSAADEAAVGVARTAWKALKGAGHEVTYWQQTDAGRWEKRA